MPDAAVACLSSVLLEIHAADSLSRLEEVISTGGGRLADLQRGNLLSDAGVRRLHGMIELHRAQRAAQLETPNASHSIEGVDVTRPSVAELLSVREAEVLGWVAQGKRDREIAELLRISPKTVSKHLENILAKLQVEHRAAAAAWLLRPVPVPGPVEARPASS